MENKAKRILIVDDNIALARVIQFAMDDAGFETVTAKNGRIAFELAKESPFDMVITDQQMPEMSGLELCRNLRGMPEYENCPIILSTAKGLELELPRLQHELEIDATFSKPFSPSALVKAVHELLVATVA